MLEYPILMVFPVAMAFAGAMDFFTMTIPNRVSLALIGVFVVAALLVGMPLMTIADHVGAGALFLVVGIAMFSLRWCGGGDAKLLAAAALWLGFGNMMPYLLMVAIMGGVLALALLFFRATLPPVWMVRQEWAMRLHDRNGGIPYGIALAGAGLWVYPSTSWFTVLAG
ncbi:MAG: prepilin peptidase [Polyangiaceae bacterium]